VPVPDIYVPANLIEAAPIAANTLSEMTSRTNIDTLEARAARLGEATLAGRAREDALRLALSLIDLTTLSGDDTPETVLALCRKAVRPAGEDGDPPLPSAAAVCVYSALVPVAREALAGTPVRIATVAGGFPDGQVPLAIKIAEVECAIGAGVDEVDMVINRGAFLSDRHDLVREEIAIAAALCRAASARRVVLKIILETGQLGTYENVRIASDLAIAAAGDSAGCDGAFFLKTSTGKSSPAATLPATLVMAEVIRDHFLATGARVGIKPAGGISSADAALRFLALVEGILGCEWLVPQLFRFGASSLADRLVAAVRST